MNPRYFNKAFISLTAGICLPVLSGPHHSSDTSYLLQFQPISSPAVLLIESMWYWLCPCLSGLLYMLTTVNLGTLSSDHRWFDLCVAVKTNKKGSQLTTLFLSQGTSRCFWVISLLSLGQWRPPRLCPPAYCVHVPEWWEAGKLRVCVRKCLTTNTRVFRRAVQSVVLSDSQFKTRASTAFLSDVAL